MTQVATNTIEVVKELYAAFGRADIPFILSKIAPDCEWVAPGQGIPNAGVYRGPQGAGEFFQRLAASERVTEFEPREFFTDGQGSVVALGRESCETLTTGKKVSTNWAMRFRFNAEGQVSYWESYYDTAAYLAAHRK